MSTVRLLTPASSKGKNTTPKKATAGDRRLALARLALDIFLAPDDGTELSRRTKAAARAVLGIDTKVATPKPVAPKTPTPSEMRHMAAVLDAAEAEAKAKARASKAGAELRAGVVESLRNIVELGASGINGFDPDGSRAVAAKDALRKMGGGIGPDEMTALEAMRAHDAHAAQIDAIRGTKGRG